MRKARPARPDSLRAGIQTPACNRSTHASLFLFFRGIRPAGIAFLILLTAQALAAQAPESQDHYGRGMELARIGKLAEAVDELQEAARQDPRNPKILNVLGAVLSQSGRLQDAEDAYARAVAINPGFYAARKNRASNAFLRRDFSFAQTEFEELARQAPKDFVPALFLSLLKIEAGEFEGARARLIEANRLAPLNARVVLALARVHLTLGERDEASKLSEQFLESDPPSSEKFTLGVLLAEFGANAESANVFASLRKEQPDFTAAGMNLALVQFRARNFAAALEAVDQLLDRGYNQGDVWNLRGWIFYQLGKTSLAVESLRKALDLEPQRADHYLDLSAVLVNAGESESAHRWLAAGLDKSAAKDRIYVQMALLAKSERDLAGAENWYRRASETNRHNEAAAIGLAHVLLLTGRREQALDTLRLAIDAAADSALLHYMYGSLLLETAEQSDQPQLDSARTELETALRLNPRFANTHYRLGRLYRLQKEEERAARAFERAYALNPVHAHAIFELARIASRHGDRQRAEQLGKILQQLHAQTSEPPVETVADSVAESLAPTPVVDLVRQPEAGRGAP